MIHVPKVGKLPNLACGMSYSMLGYQRNYIWKYWNIFNFPYPFFKHAVLRNQTIFSGNLWMDLGLSSVVCLVRIFSCKIRSVFWSTNARLNESELCVTRHNTFPTADSDVFWLRILFCCSSVSVSAAKEKTSRSLIINYFFYFQNPVFFC